MLAGRGNLHQAADLSKHAITLAPNVTKYRLTLANVYLAANLVLAAKRELEIAAKLDPKSQVVLEMLKRLPRTA
jgi:Tfp pilus assembly protein PilF